MSRVGFRPQDIEPRSQEAGADGGEHTRRIRRRYAQGWPVARREDGHVGWLPTAPEGDACVRSGRRPVRAGAISGRHCRHEVRDVPVTAAAGPAMSHGSLPQHALTMSDRTDWVFASLRGSTRRSPTEVRVTAFLDQRPYLGSSCHCWVDGHVSQGFPRCHRKERRRALSSNKPACREREHP